MPRSAQKKTVRTKTTKKRPKSRSFFSRHYKTLIGAILCVSMVSGFGIYYIVKSQQPVAIALPPDERPTRIDAYFSKYNMPMAGYGARLVAAADECGIDWRLLPAIAVRESTGGKRMQYNNPFGWGGAHIPFSDINDAIDVVATNLCGNNPNTDQWYSTTSTYKKLYYYNGTVVPTYPKEVQWIMEQF